MVFFYQCGHIFFQGPILVPVIEEKHFFRAVNFSNAFGLRRQAVSDQDFLKMETYANIRKLRKKLRQIEHLEEIDRDLTDEEVAKVIITDTWGSALS
jgi:hypothetical protein